MAWGHLTCYEMDSYPCILIIYWVFHSSLLVNHNAIFIMLIYERGVQKRALAVLWLLALKIWVIRRRHISNFPVFVYLWAWCCWCSSSSINALEQWWMKLLMFYQTFYSALTESLFHRQATVCPVLCVRFDKYFINIHRTSLLSVTSLATSSLIVGASLMAGCSEGDSYISVICVVKSQCWSASRILILLYHV